MDIKRILLQLCFIGALAIGCDSSSEPGSDNTGGTEVPPSVKPSDTTSTPDTPVVIGLDTCALDNYLLLVDCMGGDEVVVVRSNRSYDVTIDVSWITLKESGRAVEEREQIIEIAENNDAEERVGMVSFVMKDSKDPITLNLMVKQSAVGVVFEDKKVFDGVEDMNNNVWHPTEVVKEFRSSQSTGTGFSYEGEVGYTQQLEIDAGNIEKFFRLEKSLWDEIKAGNVKREILYFPTNGSTSCEVTSVKNPMMPNGARFGAMYRSTGAVLPTSSTHGAAFSIVLSDDGVLTMKLLMTPDEKCTYRGGVRISYVDSFGDTYMCDCYISFSFYE